MKKTLQILLLILSLIPLFFGIVGIALGAGRWLPPEAVTPAIDNQYRYLSAFYLSLAFLIWWMIPNIEKHATPLRILIGAIFIGGLARVYSVYAVGPPPTINLFGMALELGSPIIIWLQSRIKEA
jgi:hypothetical protein